MAAYLIVRVKITDAEKFAGYAKAVPAVIEKYGGRYVARGAPLEVWEGSYDGRRFVMLEFPNADAIRKFWDSDDYAEVKKLREGAAEFDTWMIPGT